MGRTVTPFTSVLNRELRNLANYRKALKKEDREIFDELWERARKHIQASVLSSFPIPMESILLSMCIELLKEIKDIRNDLNKL